MAKSNPNALRLVKNNTDDSIVDQIDSSETVSLMSGFHKITQQERLKRIQLLCGLNDEEILALSGSIEESIAGNLIENSIGYFQIPLGVATYFRIDGRDLMIPMAIEETSVIAAASGTAKWIRSEGEITTYSRGHLIIGQIEFPSVANVDRFLGRITEHRQRLIDHGNALVPGLVQRGGGIRDLTVRGIPRPGEGNTLMILHVLCDPCDAMGANLINQVCEGLRPELEAMTEEDVGICILSNLVDESLCGARITIKNMDPALGNKIQEASLFAQIDPYRAATHNKGVLNGIDPVVIATGNDWRAVEAGVHAYAARSGRYRSVTHWQMRGADLVGEIEIPLALGTVGGVTRIHPVAKIALKMLGVEHAKELGRICAAVGLTQNLGALKALCTSGISAGHMKLHSANLALAAGAKPDELDAVKLELQKTLQTNKKITLSDASKIIDLMRLKRSTDRKSA